MSFAPKVIERDGVSEDGALGGRLVLQQPRSGHRFGHDAILLAAATPARAGQRVIDLGAGVGAAGLTLARRVDGLAVTLVEIDPALTALAQANAARNALFDRVRAVCLDVTDSPEAFSAAHLAPAAADIVMMNPPFNASGQQASPERARRLAHVAGAETLPRWLETAARLLRPKGIVTLVWRADDLDRVLAATANGWGAVGVLPVHAKPGAPAIRVLVRAVRGGRGPLALLPGLTLTDGTGRPTPEAESVLRGGAALP